MVAVLVGTLVVGEIVSARELSHTLVQQQPHDHSDMTVDFVAASTTSSINASGAQVQHAVVTVKGANTELFCIVTRSSAFQNGKLFEMRVGLTESAAREALAELGYSEPEISFLILKARLNPR